ncbi:ABC transporter ATP-binding protein [Micromonospora coxensis]|uniref:ABC transporter n=1 Tax=Micromonospora coxensis TaxID=356852 RepID=A0A1C5JID8_9ACTN|nr:ABC transporter ATP-binding protein [Micromonospora coxensis]SCG70233.1 ABC transporter [Micromonospora coxensis]
MKIVEAHGLGLRTRRGWVFRDVDLTVEAGELHAVTGPPGSGRTSLLLALAGRFPHNAGTLRTHGPAALGQVAGVHEPDPALTVAEHIQERLLLLGPVPRRRRRLVPVAAVRARRAYRRDALATALSGAGFTGDVPLDPDVPGRDLTPVQRQVLGLVLATLSGPSLIVADDVDAGSDAPERAWLWAALTRLADQGYAVVASARAVEPGTRAHVHRLGDPSLPARPDLTLPPPPATAPAPRAAPPVDQPSRSTALDDPPADPAETETGPSAGPAKTEIEPPAAPARTETGPFVGPAVTETGPSAAPAGAETGRPAGATAIETGRPAAPTVAETDRPAGPAATETADTAETAAGTAGTARTAAGTARTAAGTAQTTDTEVIR